MALSKVDRFPIYNLAVQFCQDVLEQSGPENYLNLFQSLLNNVQFAPSFKYFTPEDAYNFFLCYPQVFTIYDSFVSLNIHPHVDAQQSINIQNDLSEFIYNIRREQAIASVNKTYEDIEEKFASEVSEITEILPSTKRSIFDSIIFLRRCVHPLNLKCAFKTLLYTVRNASSNFLDLPKTKKKMFVEAICKVMNNKLPKKRMSFAPFITFKKGVLLFATYLLIQKRRKQKIRFHFFTKKWERLNIYRFIAKHEILKVLETSELIVIDENKLISLSPSFEPVNFIVESYSELILQSRPSESWNSNEAEQDLHSQYAEYIDCDIQSTDLSSKKEGDFDCTTDLCGSQISSTQSYQEKTPKSIKKEPDSSPPIEVSEVDDIVEITPCEVQILSSQSYRKDKPKSIRKEPNSSPPIRVGEVDTNVKIIPFEGTEVRHEVPGKLQITDQNISLDENAKKFLDSSFIIIRRHFEYALSDHIVLSFLLAFENVCRRFVNLSHENQLEFIERCCKSISSRESSFSDSKYHELDRGILEKERVLLICYLVAKSVAMKYKNMIKQLERTGLFIEDIRNIALIQRNIKKFPSYIMFDEKRKGFIALKPPFKGIGSRLTSKIPCFPKCTPRFTCPNNYSCHPLPNENINPEVFPSSSRYFRNLPEDSNEVEDSVMPGKESYPDQDMFDSEDLLSSQSKEKDKKRQDLTLPTRVSEADSIVENSPIKEREISLGAPEKTLITDKMFSFDENWEKLLEYSFFTIKKYFKDAFSYNIILSFLLASKNVCENFAISSAKDQFDILGRCFSSISAYGESPSEIYYHELKNSTLLEDNALISCYLVAKSGPINYEALKNILKSKGICIQAWDICPLIRASGKKTLSFCNYISFNEKGFLTMQAPFIDIKRSLKNKRVLLPTPKLYFQPWLSR